MSLYVLSDIVGRRREQLTILWFFIDGRRQLYVSFSKNKSIFVCCQENTNCAIVDRKEYSIDNKQVVLDVLDTAGQVCWGAEEKYLVFFFGEFHSLCFLFFSRRNMRR
jgi:hypothetical protein